MSNIKHSDVHHFKIPKRTDGDGMEEKNSKVVANESGGPSSKTAEKPRSGNIVYIVPQKQVKDKNVPFNITYRKEPKFVPYEPYKAAVKPILPQHKKPHASNREKELRKKSAGSVNPPELHNLSIDHNETVNSKKISHSALDDKLKENASSSNQEKQVLQTELSRLKTENYELENQLKFQAQVNAELKKLLVAAVGEDIEVRVQSLTEDKLHLASQLLKTAKTLSTHQEQIEWLAGQCEVWRSKFLASSCLIEDLAKWKAGLSQKVTECKDTMKSLLEERSNMKKNIVETNYKLAVLRNSFNLNGEHSDDDKNKVENAVDMCANNLYLTNRLTNQLLGETGMIDFRGDFNDGDLATEAEKNAKQLINQPLITLEQTDVACSAVMMGASIALTTSTPHCAHCNGVVTTI